MSVAEETAVWLITRNLILIFGFTDDDDDDAIGFTIELTSFYAKT